MHSEQRAAEFEEDNNRFNDLIDSRVSEMDQDAGEQLTLDDYEDCLLQTMSETREIRKLTQATRTKTGEINDYLEERRPWGATQQH